MADQPPYPGTPRWAKIFAIIIAVVALLFFVLLLTRGPHRGHGNYMSSVDPGVRTDLASGAYARGPSAADSR